MATSDQIFLTSHATGLMASRAFLPERAALTNKTAAHDQMHDDPCKECCCCECDDEYRIRMDGISKDTDPFADLCRWAAILFAITGICRNITKIRGSGQAAPLPIRRDHIADKDLQFPLHQRIHH